ncbi:MAG: penicillin-binding protein 2 [Bacteriovoracaceae bacterium]|nr:penicillin-binding protein 2 [Bacteriovoracaceae bacterium]
MFGEDDIIKSHRQRATQIGYIVLACFGLVVFRLWYLQIYKGETLHEYSVQNRLRKELVRAPRGMIYSRDGKLLVDNLPRFDAVLTRQYLKNPETTLPFLAQILGMSMEDLQAILDKNKFEARYRPFVIKKDLTAKEIAMIETESSSLPGVSIDAFISREYKDKEMGAHLLGYISEITQEQLPKYRERDGVNYRLGDFIGQFGVEQQLDKTLRGVSGHEYVEVDALGRSRKYINVDNLFKGIEDEPSVPGNSIRLTIDHDLQVAGYEALVKEKKIGGFVALDVETGEVLAMVSNPAFDPSQFSRGLTSEYWSSLVNNKDKPLRDRVIQDHYSPGSTFKPFTAIAALEEGIINGNTQIRCHGIFKLGKKIFHSWKRYGDETVTVVDALMQSCNIFFYKVASEMDIDVLAKYTKMFGLGSRSGLGLPREVTGLVPTREWKLKRNGIEWQAGETLSCAIGQSYILASTLQLAIAYAAIANEGKVFKPKIIKEVIGTDGEVIEKFTPEVVREIQLKPTTWQLVKKGLYKVMNNPKGTGWYRRGLGLEMAGKTGTAQVASSSADRIYEKCENKPYELRHHGVFVGFAPFDNPKIAVASMVEHGCHGSSAAAPIVEAVISKYMEKYMPEIKKENEKKQLAQYRFYRQQEEIEKQKTEEEEAGGAE